MMSGGFGGLGDANSPPFESFNAYLGSSAARVNVHGPAGDNRKEQSVAYTHYLEPPYSGGSRWVPRVPQNPPFPVAVVCSYIDCVPHTQDCKVLRHSQLQAEPYKQAPFLRLFTSHTVHLSTKD